MVQTHYDNSNSREQAISKEHVSITIFNTEDNAE